MERQWSRALTRFAIHSLLLLVLLGLGAYVALRLCDGELAAGNLVLRLQRGNTVALPHSAATGVQPGHQWVVTAPARPEVVAGAVRNVILVIGDGMGIGQVSTGSALIHGPAGGLAVESAPVIGLMRTCSANDLVTDSAAAATAMASGFKTTNKTVGQLEDGRTVQTLLEAAQRAGMGTGVVTTSGLVDATPAGFSAHASYRKHYGTILAGMLGSGIEVLIGGDWQLLERERRDSTPEAAAALLDRARAAGYSVVRSEAEMAAATGDKLLALFPARPGDHSDSNGPPLAVSVKRALEILSGREAGFIVMVESQITDGAGHDNDINRILEGWRELDEAVKVILEAAHRSGDTLVLVTADHDTGGLAIVDGEYDEGRARVRWASSHHTSQWVPVFAFGPGAEHFGGVIDNTEVARILGELLGLQEFPSVQ